MGNSQFNLDKKFDSINVKDISNAKDIVDAIKKTEDKVSKILFLIVLVSTRLGWDVSKHLGKPTEENSQSYTCYRIEVWLGQATRLD